MAHDPAEAGNILFNKISVKQANLQRLVDSWLPPPTSEEIQAARPSSDLDDEEKGLFTPMPEIAGVGFTLPKDGQVRREDLSSNDKLRKQLLGKDYEKHTKAMTKNAGKPGLSMPANGNKYQPTPLKRTIEDDSEDDGGRSSLGKPKPKKRRDGESDEDGPKGIEVVAKKTDTRTSAAAPRKNVNYLDEVLTKKTEKKRKKRKNKHKDQENAHGYIFRL